MYSQAASGRLSLGPAWSSNPFQGFEHIANGHLGLGRLPVLGGLDHLPDLGLGRRLQAIALNPHGHDREAEPVALAYPRKSNRGQGVC